MVGSNVVGAEKRENLGKVVGSSSRGGRKRYGVVSVFMLLVAVVNGSTFIFGAVFSRAPGVDLLLGASAFYSLLFVLIFSILLAVIYFLYAINKLKINNFSGYSLMVAGFGVLFSYGFALISGGFGLILLPFVIAIAFILVVVSIIKSRRVIGNK